MNSPASGGLAGMGLSPAVMGTPGSTGPAQQILRMPMAQQQMLENRYRTQSVALASVVSANTVSADAPNEARRLIRAMLDSDTSAQGRHSLLRIDSELQGVLDDVRNAFTNSPNYDIGARLQDVLASLEELQVQLARTGLGALPLQTSPVPPDFYSVNMSTIIPALQVDVQSSFKARQKVREGAGIAKNGLK
ncbi:hypothetical protein EMMF5_004283 [Cystobasidiomycetes sp. EMM_F5]